ncbi:hypothetical protein [Streptomyces sp. S465]|uniref:hypothetical protein n=1 Tax=Streptomyces sp. S465 TaxID=2979468 RepID=UPI0022A870E3|nr:hypothetical protein [Streptomyces sp. S465]WAP57293.1 hypothetical protein N6H00_21320 [Streptomyces sp. S465]
MAGETVPRTELHTHRRALSDLRKDVISTFSRIGEATGFAARCVSTRQRVTELMS